MALISRMCVICRVRSEQKQLIRLQVLNSTLVTFKGTRRSFYICLRCIKNTKKLDAYLYKKLKIKQIEQLCKEIFTK